MDKQPLIVLSLCAVVLLALGSLSNVVGYQSIQTSQQSLFNERINQRDLLCQTLLDIANKKEIRRIILKSQMSRGIFSSSEMPVITKSQLRQIYSISVILLKAISKSRIQSMIHQHQLINPEVQNEISIAIEKDVTLSKELAQLKNSKCNCEHDNVIRWNFPILCAILLTIIAIIEGSPAFGFLFRGFLLFLWGITGTLGC